MCSEVFVTGPLVERTGQVTMQMPIKNAQDQIC